MTTRPFVYDALWTCLCPSFSPSLLGKTLAQRVAPRAPCASAPRRRLGHTTPSRSCHALPHRTGSEAQHLNDAAFLPGVTRPSKQSRFVPATRAYHTSKTRPRWGINGHGVNSPEGFGDDFQPDISKYQELSSVREVQEDATSAFQSSTTRQVRPMATMSKPKWGVKAQRIPPDTSVLEADRGWTKSESGTVGASLDPTTALDVELDHGQPIKDAPTAAIAQEPATQTGPSHCVEDIDGEESRSWARAFIALSSRSNLQDLSTVETSDNDPRLTEEDITEASPLPPDSDVSIDVQHITAAMTGRKDPIGHNATFQAELETLKLHASALLKATPAQLQSTLRLASHKRTTILPLYLLHRLIHDHGMQPTVSFYNAQILTNTSAPHGSAQMAELIFQEMQDAGVDPDAETYMALLEVLAIHPDSLFRSRLLLDMREKWIVLDSAAWHHIIASNIREVQPELALENYLLMQKQRFIAKPWLTLSLVYQLLSLDEVDAAYCLLARHPQRFETTHFSRAVWSSIFDAACSALNYPVLKNIWDAQGVHRRVNPSIGQCTAVLHAAARQGDTALATAAFETLTERGHPFSELHSKMLILAYCNDDDPFTALTLTTVMAAAKVQPHVSTVRPIHQSLAASAAPEQGWAHLQTLRKQGRRIPAAAADAVLGAIAEPTIDADEPNPRLLLSQRLEQAVALLPAVADLTATSLTVTTYNILLRACATAQRADVAERLTNEMAEAGIAYTGDTYEHLLRGCLANQRDTARLEHAWEQYREMRLHGLRPSRATALAFLEDLSQASRRQAYADMGRQLALEWSDAAEDGGWMTREYLAMLRRARGEDHGERMEMAAGGR